MKQSDYIKNQNIVDMFLNYLTRALPNFGHEFLYVGKNGDKYKGSIWCCNGIFDAFRPKPTEIGDSAFSGYWWPFSCHVLDGSTFKLRKGNTLEDSYLALSELSASLRDAVNNKDDKTTQLAAQGILAWGGVLKGNQQRLFNQAEGLSEKLASLKAELEKADLDDETIAGKIYRGLWMNSGYTKIFSCLVDNYVIYDGRVGAALGLLVRKFYEDEKRVGPVDKLLGFPWGEGAGEDEGKGTKGRRDPSCANTWFEKLNNNKSSVRLHTIWNIRANWLISELTTRLNIREKEGIPPSRLLEAALFMIGYDVRGNCKTGSI